MTHYHTIIVTYVNGDRDTLNRIDAAKALEAAQFFASNPEVKAVSLNGLSLIIN